MHGQGPRRPSAAPDGKARLGHISRQGPPALRWALTEAAQKIPTGGRPLRATFERIAKRRGRKIAKVAIARQTPTLCHYRLRHGEIRCLKHQPPPTDEHNNAEPAKAASPPPAHTRLALTTKA